MNVVLCVLVLVASTSLSVRHAHAHGGLPHSHGLGPAAVCPRAGATDSDGRHEHLLLCGVEVYHHDCPADDPAPDSDTAPAHVCVGFGDACDQRADTGTVEGGELLALFTPAIVVDSPADRHAPRSTFLDLVCDSARGARTGVLIV